MANVTSYCPRCDKVYSGKDKSAAEAQVRTHLEKAFDTLHDGALEEWDDEPSVP